MASGTCGANLSWTLDNGTLTISGEGEMDNYNYSNGKSSSPWQSLSSSIKKIIIGEGITSIGNLAFYKCIDLIEIKISDSVTFIGKSAFSGCKRLKEIIIPDKVTSIGNVAFWDCKSLEKVIISDKVIKIGVLAFCYCRNLREIMLPDSIIKIGDNIFKNCNRLKKIYYRAGSGFEDKLAMGNNAELIPVTPKIPAWKVENITLTVGGTDKVKDYSKETPPWHDYLKTVQRIVIEDGVKEISANAFIDCPRLEHVTIPASVTIIGDMAFTLSYCGERTIDGGKNVIWSLEHGILVIKKNPAAKSDADFSTGYESWSVVEKNIKAIKIERGIIPSKRFFEWLWQSGRDVQIKFV